MASLTGYAQLQARLKAISGTGDASLMRQLGLAAVREEKLLVHRKTGMTGRSIHVAAATARSVTVVASFAAPFLEFGTAPHRITARAAKALAWGGARRLSGSLRQGAKPTHFAKWVDHPGSKPYPFMIPGAKIALGKVGVSTIVDAWNGAA